MMSTFTLTLAALHPLPEGEGKVGASPSPSRLERVRVKLVQVPSPSLLERVRVKLVQVPSPSLLERVRVKESSPAIAHCCAAKPDHFLHNKKGTSVRIGTGVPAVPPYLAWFPCPLLHALSCQLPNSGSTFQRPPDRAHTFPGSLAGSMTKYSSSMAILLFFYLSR
ncbi:MAG: hypothetical protein DDT19_02513 [Syntrophomonadaceae bacterium]|nr:hypothetical protein [Bacillota bacterium]